MSGGESKQACLGCDYVRNVGYMEEVLAKILSKLSVKHILACKLVSKFWYRLIGEIQFGHLQFSCSPEKQKYIIYLDDDDSELGKKLYIMDRIGKISPYVTLPSLDQNYSFELICSFNGLVCFTKSMGNNDLNIHICNHANREILKLPRGSPSTTTPLVGIVFYPNKIKYKVLRFFSDMSSESQDTARRCEIYSPGDVDWRVISGVIEPPVVNLACALFPTNVSVGGRMYGLVWSKQDTEMPDQILSINMDENITRIRLPRIYDEPEENVDDSDESSNESNIFNLFTFLIEYKGCLAVFSVDDTESYVDIWSLTNPVKSSWLYEGVAKLQIDGNIHLINSIVSIGNEVMFIISGDCHIFQFLNLPEWTWRLPELASMCEGCDDGGDIRRKLQDGICEPVAFPFSESLFRCDAAN